MADLFYVADIIERMADGFEEEVMKCLESNMDLAVLAVQEQLWSGLNGDDSLLSPNYDNDPYFNEKGYWYQRGEDYKAWKRVITPPSSGRLLNLPARPDNIPNLYIDGTFHSYIMAMRSGDTIAIRADGGDSGDIVSKWGDNILKLGSTAKKYFNDNHITPWIWDYFEKCGW